MNLLDIAKAYTDGNGLITPNVYDGQWKRGSDNGTLFTGEFMIRAMELGISLDSLKPYQDSLLACIGSDGLLRRAPDDLPANEAPDDHHGTWGFLLYSGVRPSNISLPIKWAQPLLIYMYLILKGNPLYVLLSPIASLIIAFSNNNTNNLDDVGDRLLSYCAIMGLSKHSWLCNLAGKIWMNRINRTYPNGMYDVASKYFQPNHPIALSFKK